MLQTLLKKMKGVEPAPFCIKLSVLREIRDTIGSLPAENGGVFGGHPDDGVVTEFFFDESARRSMSTYTPDDHLLNRLFTEDWNPRGIRLMGFVHSHPGLREPSGGDLTYCRRILERIPDMDRLLIPIVISAADNGRFEIFPYAAVRIDGDVQVVSLQMTVLDDEGQCIKNWESKLAAATSIEVDGDAIAGITMDTPPPKRATARPATMPGATPAETFRRVVDAYDLDLMMRSRVVHVGTGGGAGFIEDLARAGVGQHILIDPDEVTETNLATQQAYRRDIGRPKVEAIAERIRDINPASLVIPLHRSLDDIDDREFEFLANGQSKRLPVSQTLICGLTDNFFAQARVNRLALQFGLPSMAAQVYQEGRAAEVTFTHPGATSACHRCVLSSRYQAYIDGGYENVVTSDGTPIFATTRLNALKGFVAMALLHHGTSHPRWGGLLAAIGNRNLIQVRMDPDLARTVGLEVFDRVFDTADSDRILFDETVWLPQEPEGPSFGKGPACPDCGGTGNLQDSMDTFNDTRVMRKSRS